MGATSRRGWLRYWRFPAEVARQCAQDDLPLLAAALAHFGMLTIIPLMLVASYVFGEILRSPESFQHALDSLSQVIPVSTDEITQVLNGLRNQRIAYGGFGLLMLLWICQRVFTTLQRALDKIWGIEYHQKRSLWKQYLVSFATIFSLGAFAWVSLLLTPILTDMQFSGLLWLRGNGLHVSGLVSAAGWATSTLVSVALMFLVYRLLPSARVRSRSAIVGAAVAGVMWEAAKFLVTWWVGRHGKPTMVFGAMAGIVMVMFWTYLSSLILLLGAEVVSCHAAWIAVQPVVVPEEAAQDGDGRHSDAAHKLPQPARKAVADADSEQTPGHPEPEPEPSAG